MLLSASGYLKGTTSLQAQLTLKNTTLYMKKVMGSKRSGKWQLELGKRRRFHFSIGSKTKFKSFIWVQLSE